MLYTFAINNFKMHFILSAYRYEMYILLTFLALTLLELAKALPTLMRGLKSNGNRFKHDCRRFPRPPPRAWNKRSLGIYSNNININLKLLTTCLLWWGIIDCTKFTITLFQKSSEINPLFSSFSATEYRASASPRVSS